MGEVETLFLKFNSRIWIFKRPKDLESLWEEMDSLEEEKIPYWVEIWPACKLLAKYIWENPEKLRAKIGIDIGCGLGVATLIAKKIGAKIIGLDYMYEALTFARQNALINQVDKPLFVQMDWSYPAFKEQSLDFILASDVFYEKRFFSGLDSFFKTCLKNSGFVWLSVPDREISKQGIDFLKKAGWKLELLKEEKINFALQSPLVSLWELSKEASYG